LASRDTSIIWRAVSRMDLIQPAHPAMGVSDGRPLLPPMSMQSGTVGETGVALVAAAITPCSILPSESLSSCKKNGLVELGSFDAFVCRPDPAHDS
jgi:hypothetical protein